MATVSMKKKAERLLGSCYNIRSVRRDGDEIAIRFTDKIDDLAFGISPELNEKPTIEEIRVDDQVLNGAP